MFYYSWRLFKGKCQNSQDYLTMIMGISYQFGLTTAIECPLSLWIMPSIAMLSTVAGLGQSLTLVLNSIAGPLFFPWLWQESMALSPGHIKGVPHFGVIRVAGHGRRQAFKISSWLLHILTRKHAHRMKHTISWVQEWFWVIIRGKPGQLEPQTKFQIRHYLKFLVQLWEFTS